MANIGKINVEATTFYENGELRERSEQKDLDGVVVFGFRDTEGGRETEATAAGSFGSGHLAEAICGLFDRLAGGVPVLLRVAVEHLARQSSTK